MTPGGVMRLPVNQYNTETTFERCLLATFFGHGIRHGQTSVLENERGRRR